MLGGVKLLLLQAAIMVLLPVSDPSVNGSRRVSKTSTSCERKIAECGEFQPPSSYGAKEVRCRFNKKRCGFYCGFTCKKGPKNLKLKPSTRSKEHYMCKKKTVRNEVKYEWTRRDASHGYCKAYYRESQVHKGLKALTEELDDLINNLMNTSYEYLGMASFYAGVNVALPGFTKRMIDLSEKDMKYARELITYIAMRGGDANLMFIPRPSAREDLLVLHDGKRPGLAGLERALNETRSLNIRAVEIIELATENREPHLKHFLEDGLLDYLVNSIKKLADLIHRLQTFTNDEDYVIGEFSMDLELRD